MKNNFDFLRLLFALFVVIEHCYVLSGDSTSVSIMTTITSGQMGFSTLGLNGFFIISGYLIFQSLERSTSLVSYFWKRILRLFPALLVVLLLTVLLTPFVYESTIPFLKNSSVYYYLPRNISLYHLKYNIKGVFENNPFPAVINGSLWTICYEFSMYIVIAILFFIRNKRAKLIIVVVAFVIMYVIDVFNLKLFPPFNFYVFGSTYFFKFGTFFMGGALLALLEIEKIKNKKGFLFLTFLTLLFSFYFEFYETIQYIFLTLFIILLGIQSFYPFNKVHEFGDLSYGIYIYSFPIQQTLMYYYSFKTSQLMLYSILLSVFFGFLSWHLVEKYALKFKKLF